MKSNLLSKFQRFLGRQRKAVFSYGLLLLILPLVIYLIANWGKNFDYTIFLGFYYSIFSVFLGLVVFLELQEKKVSENNEDFMNILINIVESADEILTIYSPNANIGQVKVHNKFDSYKSGLLKFLKKSNVKLTFYSKPYLKGTIIPHSFENAINPTMQNTLPLDQNLTIIDGNTDIINVEPINQENIALVQDLTLDNNTQPEDNMIYFILNSFTSFSQDQKNSLTSEVNHFLLDLNHPNVEFKVGNNEKFNDKLFAVFNDQLLFFGVYSEDDGDIKGETFTSKEAINSLKKLLEIN